MPINVVNGVFKPGPAPISQKDQSVEAKRLERACQDFEAILIHHMMKTMRQAIPRTSFMDESKERELFQALFDEEISKTISKRNGLGIGKVLYQQLQKKRGEACPGKEVHQKDGRLEERDRAHLPPPRPGSGELSQADRGNQGRGQMLEGRGDRAVDPVGQGD